MNMLLLLILVIFSIVTFSVLVTLFIQLCIALYFAVMALITGENPIDAFLTWYE